MKNGIFVHFIKGKGSFNQPHLLLTEFKLLILYYVIKNNYMCLTPKRPSGDIYDPRHIFICAIVAFYIRKMFPTMNLSNYFSLNLSEIFTEIGPLV